jgi:hypothetical protein
VSWQPELMRGGRGHVKEVAVIPIHVFEDERWLGYYDIRFEHAPNRIQDQNNAPTYMHWSNLETVIRRRDYTDWWIVLERLTDGTFRLTLSSVAPAGE